MITIVGGGGFLGVNLARLLGQHVKYLIIDRNLINSTSAFMDKFLEIDILSDIDRTIFEINNVNTDTLIWMPTESIRRGEHTSDLNTYHNLHVRALSRVLDECKTIKKVIYISSTKVYGKQKVTLVDEDTIPNPLSSYAITKLMGEYMLVDSPATTYVLRLGYLYGPHQHSHNVLPIVMRDLYATGEAHVSRKNSHDIRDDIYVYDAVFAIIKCIEYVGKKHDVFNIGGCNPITLYCLCDMVVGFYRFKTHRSAEIVFSNDIKYGSSDNIVMNCGKALSVLKWKPSYDLEKGVWEAFKFFLEKQ